MNAVAAMEDSRLATYRWLMGRAARQSFNSHALASMLASNSTGFGGMPALLGLDAGTFRQMLRHTFPGVNWPVASPGGICRDAAAMPEYGELKSLFTDFAAPHLQEEPWWIELLIVGCGGREHLWRDLGLFDRHDLNLLMQENFPALAARNDRDMKWKKFLYKQLCEREGIIACPAPTCDECAGFAECFAPED